MNLAEINGWVQNILEEKKENQHTQAEAQAEYHLNLISFRNQAKCMYIKAF